jgi:hypothetical protein
VRPVAGSFDQLLMHVNDTLTFRMRGESCRLESYNVTIVHLSTSERFSLETKEALAGRFPTFTAPREGVYLPEISVAAAAGGDRTCTMVAEFNAAAGVRGRLRRALYPSGLGGLRFNREHSRRSLRARQAAGTARAFYRRGSCRSWHAKLLRVRKLLLSCAIARELFVELARLGEILK